MKKRFASVFLAALFATALSQLFAASAQQDNKASPQTPSVEPAKPTDTPTLAKASADDKTPAAKTNSDAKLQKLKDDKIILGTDIVNVTVSVTDPYGRFVTGLAKDHFDHEDDRRPCFFPKCLQRAGACRDMHSDRLGASTPVFNRFLSDRHCQRCEVAQSTSEGESTSWIGSALAQLQRRISIVQEVNAQW